MYTWGLCNHGSDGEGSVDKTLAAPQHTKKVWEPLFSSPLFISSSQEKPSSRSWGLCRWQPHALAGQAPISTVLHFSSALLRFCRSSPSSRRKAASGPAVPLPGTQHPCGKVRIGPFHIQQETREPEKPQECGVLNNETHCQELQAFRVCAQPWKRVPASSPRIGSESRGHSVPKKMHPASLRINQWIQGYPTGLIRSITWAQSCW